MTCAGVLGCRRESGNDPVLGIAKTKIHDKEIRIALSNYPTLEREGSVVEMAEDAKRPPLLLVRWEGEIRAFMNLCTHAACPLLYDEGRRQIACNPECGHGSVFGVDGSVVRGPATAPLFRFPTTLSEDGETLTVRLRLRSH